MSVFLEKLIKTNVRYIGFTLYDKEIPFKDTPLFSDKYVYIQIHDTTPIGMDIVGFSGVCKVENDEVIALDGDSYTKEMTVVGYSEFKDDCGRLCLDLLVNEW